MREQIAVDFAYFILANTLCTNEESLVYRKLQEFQVLLFSLNGRFMHEIAISKPVNTPNLLNKLLLPIAAPPCAKRIRLS
jgi:hypothetical protein